MKQRAQLPTLREMRDRQKFIEKTVRFFDQVIIEQEQRDRERQLKEGSPPDPFRSDTQIENFFGFTVYRRHDMLKGHEITIWYHSKRGRLERVQQVLSSNWFNIVDCFVHVFRESSSWKKELNKLVAQDVPRLFAEISRKEKLEEMPESREKRAKLKKEREVAKIHHRLALESGARRLGFRV